MKKIFQKGVCNIPTQNFRVTGFSIENLPRNIVAGMQDKNLPAKVKELGIEQCFAIQSCNRVQLYYFSENDRSRELLPLLSGQKEVWDKAINFSGSFALRYFLESAVSMHSFVAGDSGIHEQFVTSIAASAGSGLKGMHIKRLEDKMLELKAQDFLKDVTAPSEGNQAVYLLENTEAVSKKLNIIVLGTGAVAGKAITEIRKSGSPHISKANIVVASKDKERLEKFVMKHKLNRDKTILYNKNDRMVIPQNTDIIFKCRETSALLKSSFPEGCIVFEFSTPKERQLPVSENIKIYTLEDIQNGLVQRAEVKAIAARKEEIIAKTGDFVRKNFYPESQNKLVKIAASKHNSEPCKIISWVTEELKRDDRNLNITVG